MSPGDRKPLTWQACAASLPPYPPQQAAAIAAAERILVVGGGTVGVELAAELAHRYKRTKAITLVGGSQPGLLSNMAPGCGAYAATWLASKGVEVRSAQRSAHAYGALRRMHAFRLPRLRAGALFATVPLHDCATHALACSTVPHAR